MKAALTSFDMRCSSSNDPYLDELRLACGSLCFHPESIAFHGFRLTGSFVFMIHFSFCFSNLFAGLMLTERAAISAAAALE
jgi:hypothetical protein